MFPIEESISIETPESVTLESELAGFGSRVLAAFVDYLIIFFAAIILSMSIPSGFDSVDNANAATPIAYLILFAIFAFYHLVFEFLLNGQTPGKRLLKIRVVQASGMPVTLNGVLIRNLVRLFDMFPAFYVVGLISIFITRRTQRLGDLAARTIVIRERSKVSLTSIRNNSFSNYAYISRNIPVPDYIRIDLLSEQDHQTLMNYLHRRSEMYNRDEVSVMLAQRFGKVMELNEAQLNHLITFRSAEEFLEFIARAFQLAELTY